MLAKQRYFITFDGDLLDPQPSTGQTKDEVSFALAYVISGLKEIDLADLMILFPIIF
ncbi:MAG: hypothetical protein IPO41_15760 [Acidobacteria bacterium]|nr:hypothetical protein [Acidobacteriota bacterium]MBP7475430.1 hypothetical protein [Pyrinomonadaceae bacterium]